MKFTRRQLSLLGLGLGLSAATGLHAQGSAYPTRAVKLINPFPPGSPVDAVARLVQQILNDAWSQPVVVESKPGAGGTLGSDLVAKAAPDGHTLLVTSSSSHAIAPSVRKQMPFDARKDFTPLAQVGIGPTMVVVHPSVPAKTLAELVQYAKANPGKLAYASSGPGTILHLMGELFTSKTGIEMLHVPYKGAVPAATDLLGGQVQVMFDSISNATPQVKAGKLRALAVITPERSAQLPDVPTVAEAGFAGIDFPTWIGMFGPADLPADVSSQVIRLLEQAFRKPEPRERLLQAGILPALVTGDAFAKQLEKDQATVAALVKQAKIPLL